MRVLNNLAAFLCALRTTQLSQSVNAGCCAENLALSCRFPQTSEHVVFNRREGTQRKKTQVLCVKQKTCFVKLYSENTMILTDM